MRIYLLTFVFSIIGLFTLGQTAEPRKSFDKLSTISVKNHIEATASFDTASSTVYNAVFTEIKSKPKGFNLEDFECELNSIIIAEVLIDNKSKRKALLTFDVCPEYEFNLYDLESKKALASFSALNIVIPEMAQFIHQDI